MKRWVLIGALVLAGVAVFLLTKLGGTADASEGSIAALAKREQPPLPKFPAGRNADPDGASHEEAAQEGPPKKLDAQSTEFFQRFDEMIARRLTAEAAACYNGGKERDQKVKFGFRAVIRNGAVSIENVKMLLSTLNDPALERCMAEKVAKFSSWKDETFPDYEMEDEVLIRVRALKKHKQAEDTEYFPPTELVDGY